MILFKHIRFPDSEYEQRLKRTQKLMGQYGFDSMVLTDDRHTWYFTGFGDTHPIGSKARPRILLIPADGEPVFLVHRSTEVTVREMTWFDDIRTYSDLTQAPIDLIQQVLSEWGSTCVGSELGREQRVGISAADFLKLNNVVPLLDASRLLWDIRTIKSPLEIERIAEACRITSLAYEHGFQRVSKGMTEREIADVLTTEMAAGGAMGSWIWVITHDYNRIDGVMRSRATEEGDLIFVDMGANYGGYWADFSRTAIVGKPTSAQIDTYQQIVEVCSIGVELLKPGNSFREVAERVNLEMKRRNLVFNSKADRYGHGLGMATTEPPNVWDDENGVIQPGMVLTMEPGMFRNDGMFHIEENVEITQTGHRILSFARRDMIEI